MDIEGLQQYLFTGAGASIDSRTLSPGEVFFALPGTRTHGAAYARNAWEKGAAYIVLPTEYALPEGVPMENIIFTEDPLALLGKVAAAYRRLFSLPVIAVGGSNGKTTTKALLGHILSQHAPTLISPKSWNNAIGIPLTLLRLKPFHKFAVVEIGDNRPGEVRELCYILQPTMGLITNVGEDHMEGYGSLQANRATKWELAHYLIENGGKWLLLNGEDKWLASQHLPERLQVEYFGTHPLACVSGEWIPIDWWHSRLIIKVNGETFESELPLWGSYNRLNVLAALAAGHLLGLAPEKMIEALVSFQTEACRSQVFQRGEQIIILDAYNANPSSLRASLEALWETLRAPQSAALILGQMEELGSYTYEAHYAVIRQLLPHSFHIQGVVFIGPYWREVLRDSLPFRWEWRSSVNELKDTPPHWLTEASVLYLKGSRKQALEKFLER